MRVSDFLGGRGDDSPETQKKSRRRKGSNVGPPPSHSAPHTPRSLLCRWRLNGSGGAREGTKLGCFLLFPRSCCKNEEKEEGFCPGEAAAEEVSSAVTAPAAVVDAIEGDRERKPEALSFNLGMGAGLIFLLAKSASEFNKMTELRSEMEMMLKYIKSEIQIKPVAPSLVESKVHTFPTSNYWGSESSNKPLCLHDDTESCNFTGAYNDMFSHKQSNWHMDLDSKKCPKDSEMEQELEVELQRLQLNLEAHDSSVHQHQDRLELGSESGESFNETYQEVKETKAETSKHTGVCPHELERRLHELLEARQSERIAELESALEQTERKLNEKEVEVCWWRDTARLVSKHREDKLQLQF